MGLLQLAFPDDDDEPTFGLQLPPDLLVPLLIAGDFGLPELRVGLGNRVVFAILMAMPETAVDKDDGAVLGKDDVRGAGQFLFIYSIAETMSPEHVA